VATGKKLSTSSDHGRVLGLALSPNGKVVAVVAASRKPLPRQTWEDATVELVDGDAGRRLAAIPQPSHPRDDRRDGPTILCFSPDGKRLLGAGAVFAVGRSRSWIYDIPTARIVASMDMPSYCSGAAFSPDGRRVALGDTSHIMILDVEKDMSPDERDGKRGLELEGGGLNLKLAFAPGGLLASTDETKGERVKVWDANTGRLVFASTDLRVAVGALAFQQEKQQMRVMAVSGNVLREWDVASGSVERTCNVRFDLPVSSVYDGKRLIGAGAVGVKVWSVTGSLDGVEMPAIAPVAFSPDGRRIAFARSMLREDGAVRRDGGVVDAESLQWLVPIEQAVNLTTLPVFSPDSRLLAQGFESGKLWIQDVEQHRTLFTVMGPPAACRAARFNPDGSRLAAGWEDGQVWLIDPTTGRHERLRESTERAVTLIEYGPRGELLLCECDVARGVVPRRDGLPGPQLPFVGLSPCRITVLEPAGGERTVVELEKGFRSVTFSPDGSRVGALRSGQELRVWSLRTGEEQIRYRLEGGTLSPPAFSADGEFLAVGSSAGEALVWRLGRPEPLHTLRGHQDQVVGVGFSPDGRRLVSAGAFGLTKLWDLKLGQEVLTLPADSFVSRGLGPGVTTLRGDSPPVAGIRFSSDGRRLFVGDEIAGGRLWNSRPAGHRRPPRT
jgi:WD40 repeat protein